LVVTSISSLLADKRQNQSPEKPIVKQTEDNGSPVVPNSEGHYSPEEGEEYYDSEEDTKSSLSYIVKEYNGKIAVFEEGKNKPFKVTDSSVSDLPEYDRKLLEEGIKATTKQELQRILEDYCS
jgi:hypothetical protein